MHSNNTYFLAFCVEIVDSLLSCLSDRTHCDNHTVGILCTVIVKQAIFATGDF